jgi:hypothetical protein
MESARLPWLVRVRVRVLELELGRVRVPGLVPTRLLSVQHTHHPSKMQLQSNNPQVGWS